MINEFKYGQTWTIFGPTLFLLYINVLHDIICNIAIYADDTTLCSKHVD